MIARRQISLENEKAVRTFVFEAGNSNDDFFVQNNGGDISVKANSLLGMAYIVGEDKELFLFNKTHNGLFPSWVEKYALLK